MSSLIVKVRKFFRLPHPNADSLFVAIPNGTNWQCCCRISDFEDEELGIYIPVDSLLPVDMVNELKLLNSKEGLPYRLRTVRLRSKLSQGLLIPNRGRFKEGEDVAEALGITKYVEPDPAEEDLRRFPQEFVKYTDIENIMNFPDVLQDGEEVVMTEKIHGGTFRCAWTTDEFYCGSARTAFKPDANSKWLDVAHKYDLVNKLRDYPNVVVYGELFGAGVQSLRYGLDDSWDLRIFDIYFGLEDRYANFDEMVEWCEKLDLPMVPLIYRGEFNQDVLRQHTTGDSTMASHIREGVIIKCVNERWNFESGLGRVILKSINPDFSLKHCD